MMNSRVFFSLLITLFFVNHYLLAALLVLRVWKIERDLRKHSQTCSLSYMTREQCCEPLRLMSLTKLCFSRLHRSFFVRLSECLSNTKEAVRAWVSCIKLPSALPLWVTTSAEVGGVSVAGWDRTVVQGLQVGRVLAAQDGAEEEKGAACQLHWPGSSVSECRALDVDKRTSRQGQKRTDNAKMRSWSPKKSSDGLSSWNWKGFFLYPKRDSW